MFIRERTTRWQQRLEDVKYPTLGEGEWTIASKYVILFFFFSKLTTQIKQYILLYKIRARGDISRACHIKYRFITIHE